MQSTIKLQLLCLWLCLCWAQVLGQDIEPEFPEDFATTTIEPATIAINTEPAEAETTERATTSTTEAATTEAGNRGTTTSKPETTTTNWRPTYPPASRPTIPWFEGSQEEPICYLKDHREPIYNYYWSCGVPIVSSLTSCYRCCYYKFNGFSGCSKLHSGRCEGYNFNWEFD